MYLKIELTFHFESPVCIGGGLGESITADIAALRRYLSEARFLLLPGSTIKGRVRAECERLLRAFGHGNSLCNPPRPDQMCPQYWWRGETADAEPRICPLCAIFGSPWQPSPLFFSDALWKAYEEPKEHDWATDVRPGVSIARTRKTAQEGQLYFVETTRPGLEPMFTDATIEGKIAEVKDAALLLAGIHQVLSLGNGRSRGRGWLDTVKPRIKSYTVDGEEWTDERFYRELAAWRAS